MDTIHSVRRITVRWAVASAAIAAFSAAPTASEALSTRSPRLAVRPAHDGGDRNPAMNRPYYWAWKTFVEVNGPDDTTGRPRWESWASDTETFPECPDPDSPPKWPGRTSRTKVLGPRTQVIDTEFFVPTLSWYVLEDGVPTAIPVTDPQEVRRNKPSFDYIVDNGFYYTEGLEAVFAEVLEKVEATGGTAAEAMSVVTRTIKFPIESIEIKIDWVPMEDVPEPDRSAFYSSYAVTVDEDGNQGTAQEYALVAMHISTKDIPTWFWATWMNEKVLGRCDYIGCKDEFGVEGPAFTPPNDTANYPYPAAPLSRDLLDMMKAVGLDEVFRNYRLVGTQTNYVDPTGQPTLMSNTITEQNQLQTGSCMTCHARAAFEASGEILSIFSDDAAADTPVSGDALVTNNGAPDPTWFWTFVNGEDDDGDTVDYFSSATEVTGVTAVQLDFVWGLLFANSVDACD